MLEQTLKALETELNNIYFCNNYGRRHTVVEYTKHTSSGRPYANYFVVGKIWIYTKHTYAPAVATFKPEYQKAIALAKKCIQLYNPAFNYTSIQFAKNMKTKKHIDSGNRGASVIIGLGDYEGGELGLDIEGTATAIDIHYKPLMFNGNKNVHETHPWTNTRYSITFFTCAGGRQ